MLIHGDDDDDDDDDDVRCCDSGSSASKSTENSGADGGKLCHIYAQIRESSTPSNVVVCSGDQQQNEKLVYTSESNVVRVQLTAADDNDVYFLIKFEGLRLVDRAFGVAASRVWNSLLPAHSRLSKDN